MKHFRVCLVCHANGVDKAISVGAGASPGPLVSHLQTHNAEYQEYMEKKFKNAEISVTSAFETQSSIVSFIPQVSSMKQAFKRKYAQWVVEESMPLNIGESAVFLDMMKAAKGRRNTIF
jgi:hypothetical protein